jgi:hypothetical protein
LIVELRESTEPGIGERVERVLVAAFVCLAKRDGK